jgi:hypothetical protein
MSLEFMLLQEQQEDLLITLKYMEDMAQILV